MPRERLSPAPHLLPLHPRVKHPILTPALQGRGAGPRQGRPISNTRAQRIPLDLGVQLASRVGLGEPWGSPLISGSPLPRRKHKPPPALLPAPAQHRLTSAGERPGPAAPAPRHMAPGAENRGPRRSGRPGPAAAPARRVLAPALAVPLGPSERAEPQAADGPAPGRCQRGETLSHSTLVPRAPSQISSISLSPNGHQDLGWGIRNAEITGFELWLLITWTPPRRDPVTIP